MTITAGAAQVEVTPAFPAWRRKVSAEVTGPHMTALGRRGGEQVTTGFESGTSRLGEGLKRGVRTGLVSLGAMGTAAGVLGLKTAAAGENAEIAFTTMLKSGSKARKFLGELKAFAATTPFELPELQTASQSLVSAGVNADKVIPIMRTLGNVTAGMGTGQEGIKRATVAIQQMQAAQKISGEDLNQLRDAGIPVYDLLAKSTGRAKGEVVELARQGKLGKKDLDAMMRGLETGKGLERFNGMMGKQSKSLAGMWSTLKDTTTMGLAGAVQPLLPTVKKGLGGLTKLVEQNAPRLRSGMQALVDSGPRITAFFRSLNTAENRAAFTGLKDSFASLGPAMSQAKGEGPRLASVLNGVASAVRFAADHVDTLVKYAPTFLGLLAGYKLLQGANNLLGRQSAIGMGMQVAATLSLAASNRALAASQKAVAVSTGQATAAEKVGLLTRIRTRAATIASTIAERAATVAKKAGAIATRVLNAAMRMNPLGIVITALTALGVGLVIAYKKSATFRRIVDGAFSKVKAVASSVVGWFRSTAWPWLSRFFTDTGTRARSLYTRYIGPAFSKIGSVSRSVFGWIRNTGWPWVRTALGLIGGAVRTLWSKAIKPYFGFFLGIYKRVFGWLKNTGAPWVRAAFQAIGDKAKWLWEKGVKTPFARIRSGLGAIKDAAIRARDGIRTAWSKLNEYLRAPIRKALGWMNSKFIGGINGLLSTKILSIPKSWRIPTIKGFDTGGWTGPGARLQPAGVVHADEFVVKKSSRRKFEKDNPGTLDHINRFGTLPGYAIGGKVSGLDKKFLEQLSAFNAAAGGRYSVLSGYRSIAHQQQLYNRYLAGRGPVAAKPGSSQHNFGLAADLTPSNAREAHGALAKQFGLIFTVPSESWHVEPTWGRSGKGGGGFNFGLPSWLTNPLKWVKSKLSGAMSTLTSKASQWGIAGQALPAITTKVRDAAVARIKKAADSLVSFGGGGTNISFDGIKGGTNKILGKAMAAKYGWTGHQWNALSRLWDKESNWNHRAKNPSSGAYGIPQSLPASKMASVMQGGGPDYLTNPKTQISWGLKYIKGRYRTPAAALAFHNRMNWYHDGGRAKALPGYSGGTHNATPGPHWVGEHGRELVWFRGGERVTSNTRSRQMTSAPRGPVEMRGRLTIDPAGVAWFEGVAEDVFNDLSDGAAALAGMGRS